MSRWNVEYQSLSIQTRTALNELVNAIFRHQTGFGDKIDPKTQPQLAAQWITIRDAVLAHRQKFTQWLQQTVSDVASLPLAVSIYQALDTTPPWIRVARNEIGTREIPGLRHNPRIMEYIWTCANIQQRPEQRIFTEREGEEGIEWCSAFVNWCLRQAGLVGTNHAHVSSWSSWGIPLAEPQQGAIVCFSWSGSKLNHVAFCDEVNGELRMLGGNQTPRQHDKQKGDLVSSESFNRRAVKHIRWPLT